MFSVSFSLLVVCLSPTGDTTAIYILLAVVDVRFCKCLYTYLASSNSLYEAGH